MTKAKRRSPSRVRYAAAHPTIGVHVDEATYDRLMALREQAHLSFAHLILRALGEVELDVNAAFEAGRRFGHGEWETKRYSRIFGDGYDAAVAEFQITVPCTRCDQNMVVDPDSPMAAAVAAAMKEGGWHHVECPSTP